MWKNSFQVEICRYELSSSSADSGHCVQHVGSGPNTSNQKMINMRDGIIPSLLHGCRLRMEVTDWEIAKNAALAVMCASLCEMDLQSR